MNGTGWRNNRVIWCGVMVGIALFLIVIERVSTCCRAYVREQRAINALKKGGFVVGMVDPAEPFSMLLRSDDMPRLPGLIAQPLYVWDATMATSYSGATSRSVHVFGRDVQGPRSDAHVAEAVHDLRIVQGVSICAMDLRESTVEGLCNRRELKELELVRCRLSPRGLNLICRSLELQLLDLSYTNVGPEASLELTHLVHCRVLRLRGCGITDECLPRLGGMQRLEALDISETAVSANAVDALARELPLLTIMRTTDAEDAGIAMP